MAGIPSLTEPLAAVRSLAETAANQRGATLIGSDLRLFEGTTSVAPHAGDERISPFALGRTYELLMAPDVRRKKGAHLTPEGVARGLVAMMPAAKPSDRVMDPAVGGAAFLLAAADQLVEAGARPEQALMQLSGIDIDAGAVAVAEAALAIWGIEAEVPVRALPDIRHGDGLLDEAPHVERIVGNPPFLNQLRSSSSHTAERRAALRDRWGDLIEAYTDDAWLFLASALRSLVPGGSVAMVQPLSILAARHAAPVRRLIEQSSELAGLWVAKDRVFDAAVHVCGLVVRHQPPRSSTPVPRAVGADFGSTSPLPAQPTAAAWGSAAATAVGVPGSDLSATSETVADLATATAGFRDQFYGFVPYVGEAVDHEEEPPARLVTVGMIDVLGLSWGARDFRFAKRDVRRPVIDMAALRDGDPALGQWADERLRPKLIMATQTRVVEVWVDERGTTLPVTPVLSIEPREPGLDTLWLLAAALSSPIASAHLFAKNFGTAMSLNAMKLAARDVLAMPLPIDLDAWSASADLIRSSEPPTPAKLVEFARGMGDAYGDSDTAVQHWWLSRVGVPIES